MSPPKSCMVCGDKALGYNFSAVTCESCKAFFRRNALAKKQFTCPFNQNCEITVVTRRFCQKCRLKKCLDIGMKSENIMSEEDKLIKRRKIENNRAKRKINEPKSNSNASKCKDTADKQIAADSSGIAANDAYAYDSQSCGSFDSTTEPPSNEGGRSASTSSSTTPALADVSCESMSGGEIVDFIVSDPDRATQAINKLMRNSAEAMATLEKVINSQSDALRLISHLIAYPGDALKIISKVMNSPLNALTVFTKFMSSPTDALEIISKIVSSPQDVLHFIKQLMDAPEDALDLMNKFLNTPAEALRIINKMVTGSNTIRDEDITNLAQQDAVLSAPTMISTNNNTSQQLNAFEGENALINSMLNNSPVSANEFLIAATPSPPSLIPTTLLQQTSVAVPLAVSPTDMQYDSPESITDELHSTSEIMLPTTPQPIDVDADFSTENFDIKSFIQTSFPDNLSSSSVLDSINSLESVLTEVIRIEYEAFNAMPQEPRVKQEQHNHSHHQQFLHAGEQQVQLPVCSPSSISVGRDLNDAELMKLRELKIASEALYYPVDEDLNELVVDEVRIKPEDTHQDPKLLQVINLTAVAIKRLIKMAKKITAFRDMCQEDQVALLKGGCTEMMIMRSVMTYDNNRNTWKIPHTKEAMSNIQAEVLKLAKGNVYEEHLRFIRTFDEKWRMDENIILIMCAIVLFTPSRSRIIHSDVIKLEQNSYYYLLRRYLESVYPGCEAKSAFIKLIQKISDVERLNQFIIGVYLNVNPSQVEPLLREIFDLKNH